MMKVYRVVINLLLPPGIAATLIVGPPSLYSWKLPDWRTVIDVLFFAYLLAGIPSVIHTWIMEYFYRHGLLPSERKAVGVSSLSGLFAGFLIPFIFAVTFSHSDFLSLFLYYPALGTATGAVTALMILFVSRKIGDEI